MRPSLTLLISAAVLAACGGKKTPAPEAQVRATLRTFVTAVEKHQYQRLCDEVFAPQLLEQAQSIGLPCEVAMRTSLKDVRDPKLTVGRVTVRGKTADAEVKTAATGQPPSTDTVRLELVKKRWRVSALGADPAGPKATPTPSSTP